MEDEENTPEVEQDFEAAFNELTTGELPEEELELDPGLTEVPEEPEPEAEPEAEEAEPEAEPEPEENIPDIWENATEEQRRALDELRNDGEQWRHKFESNVGRVSALQRKINDLQSLQASTAQPPQFQAPTMQESVAQPSSEELEAFKNDYPDIANAIEQQVQQRLASEREAINQQLAQLDNRLNQSIQPIQELEKQRYIDTQMQALFTKHPDWQDVVNTTEFNEWINDQPEPVRALLESEDASEAAYILDTFKLATSRVEAEQPAQPTQQTVKNNERLQQAVTPRARRTVPKTGIPDDFEGAFAYFANKS